MCNVAGWGDCWTRSAHCASYDDGTMCFVRTPTSMRVSGNRATWGFPMLKSSSRLQHHYSSDHLRLSRSQRSCSFLRSDQAHNEIPVKVRISTYFSNQSQGHRVSRKLQFGDKTFNSTPTTLIAGPIRAYVPFLLRHLRNAQARLFENLHVFQRATILRVLLELFQLYHLGVFLNEFDMDETPLGFLTV